MRWKSHTFLQLMTSQEILKPSSLNSMISCHSGFVISHFSASLKCFLAQTFEI